MPMVRVNSEILNRTLCKGTFRIIRDEESAPIIPYMVESAGPNIKIIGISIAVPIDKHPLTGRYIIRDSDRMTAPAQKINSNAVSGT